MSKLTESEAHSLHEALDDEYRAWAIYNKIIHYDWCGTAV